VGRNKSLARAFGRSENGAYFIEIGNFGVGQHASGIGSAVSGEAGIDVCSLAVALTKPRSVPVAAP